MVPHYGEQERPATDDRGFVKVFMFPEILVCCSYYFYVGYDTLINSATDKKTFDANNAKASN